MANANIYDLADTWNDGATTFTAIKMDVTDTASAAASLLLDLQIGSASVFSVGKDVLEKKRGTNAQTFNIYNTYTDASNYERGRFAWEANVLYVGVQNAGTGSDRSLRLDGPGATHIQFFDNNVINYRADRRHAFRYSGGESVQITSSPLSLRPAMSGVILGR